MSENDATSLEIVYSATLKRSLQLPKEFEIRNRINYNQLQPYSYHVDEQCDENQAVFDYKRKRCFFVLRFYDPGYNLTESIEQCFSKGAVLSYPLHYEEVSDTWTHFSSHLQRTYKLNMKDLLANLRSSSLHQQISVSETMHAPYEKRVCCLLSGLLKRNKFYPNTFIDLFSPNNFRHS